MENYNLNTYDDVARADHFVSSLGETVKYVADHYWINYDPAAFKWVRVSECVMEGRAQESACELAATCSDPRQASSIRSANSVRNVLYLAKSKNKVLLTEPLDSSDDYLNLKGSYLNCRTGEVIQPDSDSDYVQKYFTRCAGVRFVPEYMNDPAAKCPVWISFLKTAFQENHDLVCYIQRAMGYSLTALTVEQCLFILHGPLARNGKSVFLQILQDVLGDYGQRVDTEQFMRQLSKASHQTELLDLAGTRIAIGSEICSSATINDSLLKDMTSGEPKQVRRAYSSASVTLNPNFKLWVAGNTLPRIDCVDGGLKRRIKVIPFNYQIPEDQIDRHLIEKLRAELPAIFCWVLEGLRDYLQRGLVEPPVISDAVTNYMTDSDPLATYLTEHFVKTGNEHDMIEASVFHKRLKEWSLRNGENVVSQSALKRKMELHGVKHKRTNRGSFYIGLKEHFNYTECNQNVTDLHVRSAVKG